jgi:hypothetical protein
MSIDKRDSIIKKIQLLKQKTVSNGCSEAEAMSAAEKILQLLTEYDLSMTEVEMKSQVYQDSFIEIDGSVRKPIHDLVSVIGVFTDTKVWFEKGHKKFIYHFFGSKNDVEFAHYLFDLFSNSMDFEYTKYQKTREYSFIGGKKARSPFYKGMAIRLNERLREMKNSIKKKSNENGLMVIDKSVLVISKFNELNIRLTTESRKVRIRKDSASAYYSGKSAADNINITRGLKTSNEKSSLYLN